MSTALGEREDCQTLWENILTAVNAVGLLHITFREFELLSDVVYTFGDFILRFKIAVAFFSPTYSHDYPLRLNPMLRSISSGL